MKIGMKNDSVYKFSISSILFIVAVVGLPIAAAEDCDQQMMKCALPLKVLDDSFSAGKEELEQICPQVPVVLRCIDDYTRRCLTAEKRAEFNRMYSGTSQEIQDMCKEGPYQDEYLRHNRCMKLVKNQYEECATHYKENIQDMHSLAKANRTQHSPDGNTQTRTLCCSFQDYLTCSHSVVKKTCGDDTAEFTQGFLNRMSSSITHRCQEFLPSCLDTISGAYNSSTVLNSNWLLLMLAASLFMLAHAHMLLQTLCGPSSCGHVA